MRKAFKAVPLVQLGSGKKPISILAATDLDALLQARRLLGEAVPFDLAEGGRHVAAYRPDRLEAGGGPDPERET